MTGLSLSLNKIAPIHRLLDGTMEDHIGKINILTTNFFGLYGLTNKLNLTLSFPYIYWKQYDVEPIDTHHRNENLNGLGDLTLGLKAIFVNEYFGPGQRLFVEGGLTLPTGKDYEQNPFGNEADIVDHRHFALGTGQISTFLGAEWWWRSEFPFIIGVSSRLKQALTKSELGFKPGTTVYQTFHAIQQTPIIKTVFPYLKLELRREWPDKWAGKIAPNSGAIFFNAAGQLIYEISESSSLVLTLDYPLWQDLVGSQLSTRVSYAVSYRYKSF
ncbi:MAG: hypothetical protein V3U16_00080 [Candidatus Neomarinimicrobiota bacterium]